MQNFGLIPDLISELQDFASNFHLIPGAINMILNHGNHLNWNSKTAAEGKKQELILQ